METDGGGEEEGSEDDGEDLGELSDNEESDEEEGDDRDSFIDDSSVDQRGDLCLYHRFEVPAAPAQESQAEGMFRSDACTLSQTPDSPRVSPYREQASPSPVPNQMTEDLGNSALFTEKRYVHNLAKGLNLLHDIDKVCEVDKDDGPTYYFLSQCDTTISDGALRQLAVLSYVLGSDMHDRHVLEHSDFRIQWKVRLACLPRPSLLSDQISGPPRSFAHVSYPLPFPQNECNPRAVDKIMKRRRGHNRHYEYDLVEAGTIFLAALDVSFQLDGKDKKEVFWVVFLKTKKIYNFPEHLKSTLPSRVGKQVKSRPEEAFHSENVQLLLKQAFSLSAGVKDKSEIVKLDKAVEDYNLPYGIPRMTTCFDLYASIRLIVERKGGRGVL